MRSGAGLISFLGSRIAQCAWRIMERVFSARCIDKQRRRREGAEQLAEPPIYVCVSAVLLTEFAIAA
jgi:hypothetical protein